MHDYKVVSTVEATCDKAGKVVKQCDCGSSKTESISALGHNYKEMSSTKATCTASGTTVKVCSRCNDKKTETVKALGHNYQVISTSKATCSTSGSEVKVCSRCNDKQTSVLPKTNHTYKVDVTPATCTSTGKYVQKCSVCGAVGTTKTIAALGHNYHDTITKEATCSETGTKDRVCSRCGDKKTETIEKKEHTYKETIEAATCTEKGVKSEKCTVCGNIKSSTSIPALGHDYKVTNKKDATCGVAGYVESKCTRCSDTKRETIDALSHNFDGGVTDVQPTCSSTGKGHKTCSNCGAKENYDIPKTSHQEKVEVITESTCIEHGTGRKVCEVCGEYLGDCELPYADCNPSDLTRKTDGDWSYDVCSVCYTQSNFSFNVSQSYAAQYMLEKVNALRASIVDEDGNQTLSPLVLDEHFNEGARTRAEQISVNFSHEGAFTAENIAMGQMSLDEVFYDWANSSGHYSNMVNPDIEKFGFGFYVKPGTKSLYSVQMFY